MTYQNTSLWKRTLGLDNEYVKPLRDSFLDARKNAKFLLDKIRKDFSDLTVHDITHVDSLWNVADTIIGNNYPINPLEGYVLGVSFLIHDAALSYETVGGKDALRETIQWKDAFAGGPGDKELEDFKKECDFEAIRAIHAIKAEGILEEKFYRDNGTTFYIVNEDSYREHYGEWIGKIAASHHWDIDRVESELETQINPMPDVPGEWEINAQKLACILRCADAGHIDNRRAPDTTYFYHSLGINGVSLQHWKYQNRLGQVRQDKDNPELLRITSVNSFKKDDFAAWNVAYDAIRMFDAELKKSNVLLKDIPFPHTGVAGANSKEALHKYVKTFGWEPCDFGVHTSNVKKLIENLGGSKLYGDKYFLLVVLRELIQNARDAVYARCVLDDGFQDGHIKIRFYEKDGKRTFEVEDNGIGMSLNCIKYHLLDFGSSYWKSSLTKSENQGLLSKGFKSVGKFGIGFYSIFMVAQSVEVITKRFERGTDEAKSIEFPEGLTLTPILSKGELSPSVSTIIRFTLKDEIKTDIIIGYSEQKISLEKALQILVAGLDTDVYYGENCEPQLIHSNIKSPTFDKIKWFGDLFIPCPSNIEFLASNLEVLKDEKNEIRGIVLSPEFVNDIKYHNNSYIIERKPCIKTIGGLLSSSIDEYDDYDDYDGFCGYIDGKENSISRNNMILDNQVKKCLQLWAIDKYRKNYSSIISDYNKQYPFQSLIRFSELENFITNENLKYIYANHYSIYQNITIYLIFHIYNFIFAGVYDILHRASIFYRAKNYELVYRFKTLFQTIINNDNSLNVKEFTNEIYHYKYKYYKYNDDDVIVIDYWDRFIKISEMPESNYGVIIDKYCYFCRLHIFEDGNKRVFGTWVNLLLNRLINQMIDWRKVDFEILSDLISNKKVNDLASYLEQFLSSTYLSEMSANLPPRS